MSRKFFCGFPPGRFRQLQLGTDGRVAQLSNQTKLHSFEAERAQLMKEETDKALAQCQVECEKLRKKLEVLPPHPKKKTSQESPSAETTEGENNFWSIQ